MKYREQHGAPQKLPDNCLHLFMSGYPVNVIAHLGMLDDLVCFMQKPFSQTVLANKVREALGE